MVAAALLRPLFGIVVKSSAIAPALSDLILQAPGGGTARLHSHYDAGAASDEAAKDDEASVNHTARSPVMAAHPPLIGVCDTMLRLLSDVTSPKR